MPEPIITTGAALVGAGAWFAEKIFGPSANAVGTNLAVHLQTRLPAIFGRAEHKAQEAGIDLQAIKPGLLSRMVMDASLSDDAEEITDWWANLFISASIHGDNKHAVFSDIMAVVGPNEAMILKGFMDYYEEQMKKHPPHFREKVGEVGPLLQERVLTKIIEKFPLKPGQREEIDRQLSTASIPLPVRVLEWSLPENHDDGSTTWSLTTEKWYSDSKLSVEILERERVFRFVRVDVPLMANTSSWIDVVALTELGMAFYRACTGVGLAETKQ